MLQYHGHIFSGSLPLEIPVAGLMAGANSLQIVLMDGEGASVTVTSTINIGLPGMAIFSLVKVITSFTYVHV